MRKIFHIALREFVATATTKGFLVGILLVPVLIGGMILLLPLLIDESPPKIDGELAMVDPTGVLVDAVRDYLRPEAIAERRREMTEKVDEVLPVNVTKLGAGRQAVNEGLERVLGSVPELRITHLASTADIEKEKEPLLVGTAQDGGRLALAVIQTNAVVPAGDTPEYGSYELFVREKLDERLESELRGALRHAIVAARMAAQGLDPDLVEAVTAVERRRSRTVTEEGERKTNPVLNILLPMGFMLLLLMSVLVCGQYLMTTTIEEKSSRVVEVLLSAVSPMQLMTGKVVGQMAVGLMILVLYAGIGIVGLFTFSLLGLIDLSLFFYLVVFFLIAFFVVASLMAAIGAAVNDMREAQTLMTPIVVMIMIPWMLWMPITRDPNSLFATVASLLPPINPFVMLLRMTSNTPPPLWQVWLSIAIGIASVFGALWIAAKVFRVGILMHGKPPNLATLVRWVRMA